MHGDAQRHGQPARGELLEHLQVDLVRLAAAAELLRIGQRQQPGPTEQREHVARELPGRLGRGRPGRQLPVGDLDRQVQQIASLGGGQQAIGHARHGTPRRWLPLDPGPPGHASSKSTLCLSRQPRCGARRRHTAPPLRGCRARHHLTPRAAPGLV